jgi:hypothetical protein
VQAQGKWAVGPEEGGLGRAQAARALAELCAEPSLHDVLDRSGAVKAIALHAAELVGLHSLLLPTACQPALHTAF